MSKALGMRCVWGLCGVLLSVLALASVTRAEVTTDLSGTVLIYPKVIWDGARDTVIQIANTSNNLVHAHCFYVNGQVVAGAPIWQVNDFDIWLTRQQPVHWVASQGRAVNPGDGFGNDGSGLDPGGIPPLPVGFTGELKCIQSDTTGDVFAGNSLKGEQVLRTADGDVSKANAIAILANPDRVPNPDHRETLQLNNSLTSDPAFDGEFNACPNTVLLDHFVDGVPNPVIQEFNPIWCANGECPIRNYLTIIPCTQDFENARPATVTVQFEITNELEENFSASTTVTCWATTRLADIDAKTGRCSQDNAVVCTTDQQCIDADNGFCSKNSVFSIGNMGTGTAYTRMTPVGLDGGVVAYMEQLDYNNLQLADDQVVHRAWAAWNPQGDDQVPAEDRWSNRFDATNPAINPNAPADGPVIDEITIPRF